MCGPNEVLQQTAGANLVPEGSRALRAAVAGELGRQVAEGGPDGNAGDSTNLPGDRVR
jgi:hypothetical protein